MTMQTWTNEEALAAIRRKIEGNLRDPFFPYRLSGEALTSEEEERRRPIDPDTHARSKEPEVQSAVRSLLDLNVRAEGIAEHLRIDVRDVDRIAREMLSESDEFLCLIGEAR